MLRTDSTNEQLSVEKGQKLRLEPVLAPALSIFGKQAIPNVAREFDRTFGLGLLAARCRRTQLEDGAPAPKRLPAAAANQSDFIEA